MTSPSLDLALAARLAAQALANVEREFPNKLDHVLTTAADAATPRALHPAFYGSFDWHSCVHMHWLLATLRRRVPGLPQRAAIDARFDRHFDAAAIGGELAYLARPATQSFERTYGWAWLLALAAELGRADDAAARRWSAALLPLADAFVGRYRAWLAIAQFPIRHGNHPNSAFGLLFALDYARGANAGGLAADCVAAACRWYEGDADAPWRLEPSGADFLSPTLVEALLMAAVLPGPAFAAWLERWLPGLAAGAPTGLLAPVPVSDRSDPQIVHLDGLNLSRAWCWRGIAAALPAADPRTTVATAAAECHLAAGCDGLASDDYMGAHWLASFALLALAGGGAGPVA
jgi:hypothetical protein